MKMFKVVKSRSTIEEELANDYRNGLKEDMIMKADRLISILDFYCLPHAALNGYIFFTKLKADIFRYMADACLGMQGEDNPRQVYIDLAEKTYFEAFKINKHRIDEFLADNAKMVENPKIKV